MHWEKAINQRDPFAQTWLPEFSVLWTSVNTGTPLVSMYKTAVSSGDEYNFLIFQSGYLQNPSTRKQPNVNNKMKYFIESGIFQLNTKTRKASIACAVDFTSYPFDDHRCEFAMRSSMNLSYHVFN